MEMFSGMQYVDDDSDLDLIIQNAPLTCWHELYQLILAHEKVQKLLLMPRCVWIMAMVFR